ncbi:MAG: DUF1800 domain-containing protein [Gemmataceae bacterium]|nr:DUF1800 domain-containing protein [Gemmataceae bacterium]
MNIDPRWAWAAYAPSAAAPWNLQRVGHLYRRAAFGANWAELQAGLSSGPEKTVDALLAGGPDAEPFPPAITKANNGFQLSSWWLKRLLESKHPLREKLTLFWHNHFATSNAKVNNTGAMIGMYDLLYRQSLGNFGDMAQEITLDPAMLVWLDTVTSTRGQPNENYARELMELFTLGIGHYTEADIREAARAFTGYEIKDGRGRLNPAKHDATPKTVFGQSGNWSADDIVKACLKQPACPYFIVGKLYRYLVSEADTPSRELLAPLAEAFAGDFDIGKLVARILRSNLFFSDTVYRARVKSPVEFAVGIVHALEGRVPASALALALESLGQRLGYPPNVKGWDGGQVWLNAQTLLYRQNLALALTSTDDDRFKSRTDPAQLARSLGKVEGDQPVELFVDLFLQGDLRTGTKSQLIQFLQEARRQKRPAFWSDERVEAQPLRGLCHLVLAQPEFQLA